MAAMLNCKMAATRGREYVGDIFSSSPWVGLPLCKVLCLLEKLNDSGALLLYYESVRPGAATDARDICLPL